MISSNAAMPSRKAARRVHGFAGAVPAAAGLYLEVTVHDASCMAVIHHLQTHARLRNLPAAVPAIVMSGDTEHHTDHLVYGACL